MMVAAWVVNPADDKSQPKLIPAELFGVQAIGREPAGPPGTRTEKAARFPGQHFGERAAAGPRGADGRRAVR